jgi:hypothetical protein
MALGGGSWVFQNKVLPGSYINFVSAGRASATLSDRGVVAMPLTLDWGTDGEVFSVTSQQFTEKTMELFGYPYTDPAVSDLREIFRNARMGYFYRINGTGGVKASNTYATAKYTGTGGNKITIVIEQNEDGTTFDLAILFGGVTVFTQDAAAAMSDLEANPYVDWKTGAALALTAGTPMTGGVTGTATGADYSAFIAKLEGYTFNVVGIATTDETINAMAVSWTKRLRDEYGMKFQVVLYRTAADYEGIINVENKLVGEAGDETDSAKMVFWVAGAEAACAVNASLMNRTYDGEYAIDTDYTQAELEAAIKAGKLIFHKVNDSVRILKDINSLVTYTSDKSADFALNQVIRVIDQIGNDIARIFNDNYLGKVPNDAAGRVSLWGDIVAHHQSLETVRAIEAFDPANVTVDPGDEKDAVLVTDAITPVSAMAKLYMTVVVQ